MGAERKLPQNAFFLGKRHDNKNLNLKILLSRNFVVMAQAPSKSVSLFYLRLVFVAYGGIRFGLFYLRFGLFCLRWN